MANLILLLCLGLVFCAFLGMLVDGLTPPKFGYIIGGSEVNPDDSERHKYMVSFNPSCSAYF